MPVVLTLFVIRPVPVALEIRPSLSESMALYDIVQAVGRHQLS